MKMILRKIFIADRGVALFVAMLMSMSLAVVAMASMARLSEATHTSGSSLQERKLLMYAQSAANIVNGEVQKLINDEITQGLSYTVFGNEGEGSFKYYPRDIFVNPDISGTPTLFGYRAVARRMATQGDRPPGFRDPLPVGQACYDITIDVREVLFFPSGAPHYDPGGVSFTPLSRYFLGKMKTVGTISCFNR